MDPAGHGVTGRRADPSREIKGPFYEGGDGRLRPGGELGLFRVSLCVCSGEPGTGAKQKVTKTKRKTAYHQFHFPSHFARISRG